tara:strand:+ start:501 stop:614 length:114 start_codon:yes stop_codon:yes gene_type:complete
VNKEIVLITGVAGFIGYSLAQKILKKKIKFTDYKKIH